MKLTTKLAYNQLATNKKRAALTLIGIVLSVAMITAVFGFTASAIDAITYLLGGSYVRTEYYATIYAAGAILGAIIIIVSVVVVSNAFRVSASERITQFGMLKSVGATKRQIAKIVVNEGLLLSAISIPIGLTLGVLVHVAGVWIANYMLTDLNAFNTDDQLILRFVFAWQGMVISTVLSFFTVLFSAGLPAYKVAKISAIDAIRGAGDIKIKARQMRSNLLIDFLGNSFKRTKMLPDSETFSCASLGFRRSLIRKLFGFEGELALKSLKRNKRSFRATVASLTISMVLFIAASSFSTQMLQMTNLVFAFIEADVLTSFHSHSRFTFDEDGAVYESHYVTLDANRLDAITNKMREFEGATIFAAGGNNVRYTTSINMLEFSPTFSAYFAEHDWITSESNLWISLITVDSKNYAELARLAGVPLGSNILINHTRTRIGNNWAELVPLTFTGQTLQIQDYHGNITELPLHGELRGPNIPNEIINASRSYITVLVPEVDANYYLWAAQTCSPHAFAAHVESFFSDMMPDSEMAILDRHTGTMVTYNFVNYSVFNQVASDDATRALVNTIMLAIYGFVGMLTLIAFTSVISTVSTNIRTRSREFAILQSVGLTHSGLNRMLNLESIFCAVKSIIYGIPLGIGASYLLYMGIVQSVWFSYQVPWLAILQCFGAVFVITWLTMRFSVARIRNVATIISP